MTIEVFNSFLIYFIAHNGVALAIAAPALLALLFLPVMRPRKLGFALTRPRRRGDRS